jgi:hypothetical protein
VVPALVDAPGFSHNITIRSPEQKTPAVCVRCCDYGGRFRPLNDTIREHGNSADAILRDFTTIASEHIFAVHPILCFSGMFFAVSQIRTSKRIPICCTNEPEHYKQRHNRNSFDIIQERDYNSHCSNSATVSTYFGECHANYSELS